MQRASLHMLRSVFQLLQQPKKDVTTFVVSSPAPYVHPSNTVVASHLVGLGGRFMTLNGLLTVSSCFGSV